MRSSLNLQRFAGRAARALLGSLLVAGAPLAQAPRARRAAYVPAREALPVVEALAEILPPELKGRAAGEVTALWPGWVARRDASVRARLEQGDEDTLVNFLLFGTSFTKHPRVTSGQLSRLRADGAVDAGRLDSLLAPRLEDFARALSAPGRNERLLFARSVFAGRKRLDPRTRLGREQIKSALAAAARRVLGELEGYAKAVEAARQIGNPSAEFAERSTLYRTRGLSLDTSVLTNFAVEEALREVKSRGLLGEGGVRRVAIVGPGLDFTDKQEGYDFYPQQTLQPFAVIDTLLRLGLARSVSSLEVTTLDISPRVNDHIARAGARARAGRAYVVNLTRDPGARWEPGAVRYWERFGDRVGGPVAPPPPPPGLQVRTAGVRPEVVSRVTPVDVNVVLQRLELPEAERFDLIVATNIFVYYDVFEQSLAMLNVQRMLRPGGLLLSNNALLELPFIRVRSAGYSTVVYSDRPDDGDHVVWYRRSPN